MEWIVQSTPFLYFMINLIKEGIDNMENLITLYNEKKELKIKSEEVNSRCARCGCRIVAEHYTLNNEKNIEQNNIYICNNCGYVHVSKTEVTSNDYIKNFEKSHNTFLYRGVVSELYDEELIDFDLICDSYVFEMINLNDRCTYLLNGDTIDKQIYQKYFNEAMLLN